MHDVLFLFTGDVQRNSRALKQLRALSDAGFRVHAVGFGPGQPSGAEPFTVTCLPPVTGRGPLFFSAVERVMRDLALEHPAGIYHASDIYTLRAADAAARKYSGRLVFDSRELYSHTAGTVGKPWSRWYWQRVERRYLPRAHLVFTVSDSIADYLARHYGIERPHVIHNVPSFRQVVPEGRLRRMAGVAADVPLILHQGNLQRHRGCHLLVDAMHDIDDAALVFLGKGALRAEIEQLAHPLTDRIHFIDPVAPDDLLPLTADADIGVTLLEDTCLNHRFALPNKLFEYLMAGVPVLSSDLPEIRRVVNGHGVGVCVDPSDRDLLLASLRQLIRDRHLREKMKSQMPNIFETFRWERASETFVKEYARISGLEH
jgi:glycosyltransferase involved in cell wall biosynthesis